MTEIPEQMSEDDATDAFADMLRKVADDLDGYPAGSLSAASLLSLIHRQALIMQLRSSATMFINAVDRYMAREKGSK